MINSKDLLINMDRTPDENSQEFSAFWKHERDKCKNGIIIDQTFISGFLYYHLNFFKCQLDILDNGRIIRKLSNPYLRDNEWIVDDYIRRAEAVKKGLCILGSRRLAKSVFQSSYITHRSTFYKGTQNVISGLNEPDIKVITDLCEEALGSLPTAFKHGRIEDNWKKQVTFGKKTASGERTPWSSIPIRNLDGGKNTEALAGLSPFSMVIDEIGKGDWLKCFSAAIPGFATPFGWRCSPLAFGTSGDMDKAQDARKVFEEPDVYNFLAVELPDEPDVKTSVFISGHFAHDFPKDTMPLSKYLKKENCPNLDKIEIQVTNYERADKLIDEERKQAAKSSDPTALLKLTMYHPKNRVELFLTNSNNNFPKKEIEEWITWLDHHYTPNIVELYRNKDGEIKTRSSDKGIITQFPVKHDSYKEAGIVIYEPPIKELPFGAYVGGLDLYNQNESSDRVNSLGSYCILKRVHDPLGEYQFSIVASFSARPQLKEFKETVLLLMQYYNAYTLVEHTNTEAIDWFIEKGFGSYFADSVAIAKEINSRSTALNTKGLKPTTTNQRHYMNLMVDYTKEELTLIEDDEEKKLLGLVRIKDTMLLTEMLNYKAKESSSNGIHDGNFDRIIAFGHALTLAKHLDKYSPVISYKQEEDKYVGRNVILHSAIPIHKSSSSNKSKNFYLNSPFSPRR